MKRLLITLVAALSFHSGLTAQPQQGIEAMDQAFATFVGSKEVLTKSTRWSPAMQEYQFKYTVPDSGQPVEQADIRRLMDAFAENAKACSAAYFYDHTDNAIRPFGGVSYQRDDNFFGGISGSYSVGEDTSFRIINFATDQQPTSYGMFWHEMTFSDRNGRPFRTIEGQIYKFYDGIWMMREFYPVSDKRQSGAISVNANDRVRYETLLGQVKYLANLFAEHQQKGDEQACDAAVYYLQKLCSSFEGQLSSQQFREILQEMQPFYVQSVMPNQEREIIVARASADLARRAEQTLTGVIRRTVWGHDDFIAPDDARTLYMKYDLGTAARPQVQVSLTGTGSSNSTAASIHREYPSQRAYSVAIADGKFAYSGTFDKDQMLLIGDKDGHEMAIIADSVPTEINLLRGTLHGSPLNERFADCQRRLRALEPELHLYANDREVMDAEGYNRLLAEAHDLQLQFIRENKDNLIAAWYLAKNFYTMTLDELKPLMNRGSAYADHVAMQPVWQYYEGLQKRQPGISFTDAAATDTAGVSRQLSEFIGRGDYVVLCYWDMSSREIMRTLKALRKTYEGKNLTIVCVTLDNIKDNWAKYVRKRDLRFVHLMAKPGGNGLWDAPVLEAYGITVALPETIIFDPTGCIIASGLYGQQLKDAVDKLPLHDKSL